MMLKILKRLFDTCLKRNLESLKSSSLNKRFVAISVTNTNIEGAVVKVTPTF